ncbi:MAG: hypothetical protein JJ976_12265 [Rhodothermales bacterium]|nr:hypothetical protein [Rhodothermales bacterium]
MVVFAGMDGVDYAGQAMLADLAAGSVSPIRTRDLGPLLPEMETVVWTDKEDGFYFMQRVGVSGRPVQKFYSLADSSVAVIGDAAIIVTAAIGVDTLVAGNYEDDATFSRLHLLDASGDIMGIIPTGSLTDSLSGSAGGLFYPAWNPGRRLLAFEVWEAPGTNVRIGVSDLDGNAYFVSRSGDEVLDRRPRWGPNGALVFDRSRLSDYDAEEAVLMIYDVDTGSLAQLLEPRDLAGASGISDFDWTAIEN